MFNEKIPQKVNLLQIKYMFAVFYEKIIFYKQKICNH